MRLTIDKLLGTGSHSFPIMTIVSYVQGLRITSRDSKLSWLTVAASVLSLLCSFGFLQGFGILFNAFLDQYQDSKEKTGKTRDFFNQTINDFLPHQIKVLFHTGTSHDLFSGGGGKAMIYYFM